MDTIVVGAGHNGLTAAALLSRHGREVLVVERREEVGGVAAGGLFHEGFRHAGLLHETATVRPQVVRMLALEEHGLSLQAPPVPVVPRGGAFVPVDEVEPEAWRRWRAFVDRVAPFARSVLDEAPPAIGEEARIWPIAQKALGLRRLGQAEMMELLRVGPSPVDDWLAEHFEDPAVRAALAMPALLGAWMGPRSPLSTANLLLHEALAGDEVEGGPASLVAALERACVAAGVTVRTQAPVDRILVADGAVQGVHLADGTALRAPCVVAAMGPRRALLDLVDPMHLPPLVDRDLRKVRVRGLLAKVHLALRASPFGEHRRIRLVEHPLDLERAFDDAKHGRMPSRPPPLDLRVRRATGGVVVSALVFGVPHGLRGGWDDAGRQALFDAVLASIERFVPDVRDLLVAHETLTPADVERRYALEGGHPFHGEHALDQLWALRPTPALARYATPIRGLFLASSGSHPGGGITCGPGALAARAVLS